MKLNYNSSLQFTPSLREGKSKRIFELNKFGMGFMKYNQSTSNKLEKILGEAGYVVRYERGSFQSGYCILEEKNVVVLNKFLNPEGRINTLIDLIPLLHIVPEFLTSESQKMYDEVMQKNPKSEI